VRGWLVHLAHAQVDVEVLADQVHPPVQQLQPDLQARMALAQQGQHRRQVIAAQAQAGGDAQHPARLAAQAGEGLDHAFHVFEDLLRPGEGRLAVGGDVHPPRGAVEQLDPEGLLQHGDALADVGRGDAQLGRAGHEAGAPRHAAEQQEVAEEGIIIR
jgi:hypothetical protein